ncbi:MAG: haloacid dehalogenase type II [Gammaproteobacteria bacterium]
MKTLAFDIYDTLINTNGVITTLHGMVGDKAERFSRIWRNKQLEYSFRRGLMRNYRDFSVCVNDAFIYTCDYLQTPLDTEQKKTLLNEYLILPAFDDVRESLEGLQAEGHSLFAFSNGRTDAVDTLLSNAGIRDYFLNIISADDIKTFKPDPAMYTHFLNQSGASTDNAWLISSNPFDVIGAISANMKAAWVRRSKDNVFDPWGVEPTITVKSLSELSGAMARE